MESDTAEVMRGDVGDTERTGSPATEVDVLYLTDLRFPGGTSTSLVEEVAAAASAGYRVAVHQLASARLRSGRLPHPALRELIADGRLLLVVPGEPVRAPITFVKHPYVFAEPLCGRLAVSTDRVVVLAGQIPSGPDGEIYYDPARVHANVRDALEVEPVWAPISPIVRARLSGVPLRDDDWLEVLHVAEWGIPRDHPLGDVPVIGRVSRDDALKWPATRDDLLASYPDDDTAIVRVLGGAGSTAEILGAVPERWEVVAFGAEEPASFLSRIDFFVYQHHPALEEAFGRAICEALAAGVVAIVPPYLSVVFGDACLYADPAEIGPLVARLHADHIAYAEQSARGHRFVEQHHSHRAHRRRLSALIGPPGTSEGRAAPDAELVPPRLAQEISTVLVVCLEASDEEVERAVRAVHRHRGLVGGFRPVLAVNRRRPALADELGVEVRVITSRSGFDGPDDAWPEYAFTRLRQLASTYRVDDVVVWDLEHPDAWIGLQLRPARRDDDRRQ